MSLALHALVTCAVYYLVARAEISRPLWSRFPPWLNRLMLCPACTGFWIGFVVGAATGAFAVPHLTGIPAHATHALLGGLVSTVTTPILFGTMKMGMHLAQPEEGENDPRATQD